jgi:hypothetical protein
MELRLRYGRSCEVHEFQPGDIVRQKPELAIYRSERGEPLDDEPLIVITANAAEIVALLGQDPTPWRFGRPFHPRTMILARIDEDGDFSEFVVDRRRFEPWPEDVSVPMPAPVRALQKLEDETSRLRALVAELTDEAAG